MTVDRQDTRAEALSAEICDALAYALARATLPGDHDTSRDYAERLAPLVVESGYLDAARQSQPDVEACCWKENPHRAIPTVTDRPRIARHWFDEAAALPATRATGIDAEADAGVHSSAGLRLDVADAHRDPGVRLCVECERPWARGHECDDARLASPPDTPETP